ncbi:MAG: hypothetical protein GY861_19975, partial [bacterium]|nr:hypothetical protein [bacterium]
MFTKTKAYHEGTLEDTIPQNTFKYWKSLSTEPLQTRAHGDDHHTVSQAPDITEQMDLSDMDHEGSDFPIENLFPCPVEGCIKKFRHEGNLARHLIVGQHKYALERQTAIDFAQKHYQEALINSNLKTIRKAQQSMLSTTLIDEP